MLLPLLTALTFAATPADAPLHDVASALTAATPADAPLRDVVVAQKPPPDISQTLVAARRLAEELRYEEAVVEYQRYLGEPQRPFKERARALLELGFLHLILGDEVNAQRRALEALELDEAVKVPSAASQKEQDFIQRVRKIVADRTHIEVQPKRPEDPPDMIRAKFTDPESKVKRVLIRHALAANGPFYSTRMSCEGDACHAQLPPPKDGNDFTAWYYLEAVDGAGNTMGQAAGPGSPLQVSVAGLRPWYANPWVWGVGGAAVIAAAAVFFIASSPARAGAATSP